jgi:hypothetical protein
MGYDRADATLSNTQFVTNLYEAFLFENSKLASKALHTPAPPQNTYVHDYSPPGLTCLTSFSLPWLTTS